MIRAKNKTEVVIIGGGSGAILAKKLSSSSDFDPEKHNLTLVTPHPYSIYLIACARMVVTSQGSLEDSALIPFDRLHNEGNAGNVIQGKVARILDGVVEFENGKSISYDHLVVATGCRWDGPLAFPDTDSELREHLRVWRAKFASAKRVVIAGGGAVGIGLYPVLILVAPAWQTHVAAPYFNLELSCEVKTWYPETEVTLVHAGSLLLNDTYPIKFRKAATERVKKFGIKLILDDKVDIPAEGELTATTVNGQKLSADLFVSARGPKPNTAILKSLDPSIITPSGHVRVLPTLQVPLANGKTNVFAMGDIIDWDEQHQAEKSKAHVEVVAPNILNAIERRTTPSVVSLLHLSRIPNF
jgi:apoptosis-inducing factor 2